MQIKILHTNNIKTPHTNTIENQNKTASLRPRGSRKHYLDRCLNAITKIQTVSPP